MPLVFGGGDCHLVESPALTAGRHVLELLPRPEDAAPIRFGRLEELGRRRKPGGFRLEEIDLHDA